MVKGIKTAKKPVIVGIDPGTTSAVAVLDLHNNLLGHKSAKNFSKDQIIRFIISHGKPLIIATDVSNSPSLIEEIASNMGANLFVPNEDLKAQYKEELTNDFQIRNKDAHTLDATAAAAYAYQRYEDKLQRILDRIETEELPEKQAHDVVELVMKGSFSTSTAITEVQKSTDSEEDVVNNQQQASQKKDWERIAKKRKQDIDFLNEKIEHLEEYKDMLEEKLSDAKQDNADAGADTELKKRNRLINQLRSEISEKDTRLETLDSRNDTLETAVQRLLTDDWTYVPKVSDLQNTTEDIVYCETYRGGDVSSTLDTVLTTTAGKNSGAYKSLQEKSIRIVDVSTLADLLDLGHGYLINPEDIAESDDTPERFTEWLDSYKKRQTT